MIKSNISGKTVNGNDMGLDSSRAEHALDSHANDEAIIGLHNNIADLCK